MKHSDEKNDPRRRFLIQALSAGVSALALPAAQARGFDIFGQQPYKLAEDQSIYRLSGQVLVNGEQATSATRIKPGDTLQTGENSELVFVVNSNAMILRGGSLLKIEAG